MNSCGRGMPVTERQCAHNRMWCPGVTAKYSGTQSRGAHVPKVPGFESSAGIFLKDEN